MKGMKKLIPALCLLLVSAILMGTSTYAWFSMNTTVTATGMKVQARAEEGLVISNAAAGTYDQTASSAKTTVAQLYPGSTKDLSTWLHSKSTDPAAANTHQTYTAGTEWTANSGTYGNYVVHDFYIRSSAATALTVTSLNINSVTATISDTSNAAAQQLSKALRVGIKFDGAGLTNTYIYAPVEGYSTPVSVQNTAGDYSSDAADRTNVAAIAGSTASNDTQITSIPANTANGIHAQIYVWYEGEDAACISNNIVSGLESLDIKVVFSYSA